MTKRQENALKTKQKLLDAAIKLIEENGLSDLNIENITNAAGCAKGTFYVYFSHKEDIVFEICRELFERIEKRMQKMTDKNIIERMHYYFESFMAEVERYGINICREWIRGVIDPNKAPENMDNTKWQFDIDMLYGILNRAVKEKELKADTPIDVLANVIIAELYGMMTCWCMSDGVFEPKEWTSKFFEMQLTPMLQKYLIKE